MNGYTLFREKDQKDTGMELPYFVWENLEHIKLCLAVDDKLPEQEEEADEAFYRQLKQAQSLRPWLLRGPLTTLTFTGEATQRSTNSSGSPRKETDDSFLTWVVENLTRNGMASDFILTKRKGLVGDVRLAAALAAVTVKLQISGTGPECYIWALNNCTQPLWGGTVTEEKGTKNKATVSVSTQAVTEEKETKGDISISTQTITEAEQPKPVAVAPVQKKKSKSKSVCIVTDEDVAGPSHPAEETEPEIITCSLSLGELCDLRREFTRQTNESILTWLLRIWDAAANDTILDGSEARQLGSLSRDVVIDQGIGRTQQTLSLWQRLLTSVRGRYLCKEDLQVHQGKWSTMEQGIQCLRELAVLEIIFSEDRDFLKAQMMSSAHRRCG
ncbi:hypothetical protein DUI87_03648 [Hirundo rustica rustica]|uniref:Uncharacterized protein n=1 Tax=Hirundo rustica rustica TaxID=333673 RepID=A0A3M0L558_HIRRU|nr:hypothetical protein DUI87_03648 [Hirundo rustica rustica]